MNVRTGLRLAGALFLAAAPLAHASAQNQLPRLQTWDGTRWTSLPNGPRGTDPFVHALTVFDDGNGPALYAGGRFRETGSGRARYVARWDGEAWSALGEGVEGGTLLPAVRALAVYDDGDGPALYAGGTFRTAGGVTANHVARWDGERWSALGSGLDARTLVPEVRALAVFDDGDGAALYAGGTFLSAGGVRVNHVAKWDGESWSALGSGLDGGNPAPLVQAFAVHDDGRGNALFAGGNFLRAGGVRVDNVARWDGKGWSALAKGVDGGSAPTVHALAAFDDGGGAALYAGGTFLRAGGKRAARVARWDGRSWSALGKGVEGTLAPTVYALEVLPGDPANGGGAPALAVGGTFLKAGGVRAKHAAAWRGGAWSALGKGVRTGVLAWAVYAGRLVAGG